MKVQTKSPGRKPTNQKAFDRVRLAGKSAIVIRKNEWKLKVPPGAHIFRKYLKAEYVVKTLSDDSGWLVKKV